MNVKSQCSLFLLLLTFVCIRAYAQESDVTQSRNPKLIQQYLTGKWKAPDGDIVTFSPTGKAIGRININGETHSYTLKLEYLGRKENGSEAQFVWILYIGENKDIGAAIAVLDTTDLSLVSGNYLNGNYAKLPAQSKKK